MLLNNQLITCVRRNPQINRQKIISNLENIELIKHFEDISSIDVIPFNDILMVIGSDGFLAGCRSCCCCPPNDLAGAAA